jgi:hypothetical protein
LRKSKNSSAMMGLIHGTRSLATLNLMQ